MKNVSPETAILMSNRKLRRQRGAGMAEYLILLVLVAIVSVSVASKFGVGVKTMFETSSQTISNINAKVEAAPVQGSK